MICEGDLLAGNQRLRIISLGKTIRNFFGKLKKRLDMPQRGIL
jgi:hypothetical protein